jgi:hypothetical protein
MAAVDRHPKKAPGGGFHSVRTRSTTDRMKPNRHVRRRAIIGAMIREENKEAAAELAEAFKKGWPGINSREKSRRGLFVKALIEKKLVTAVTDPKRVLKLLKTLERDGVIRPFTKGMQVAAIFKEKRKKKTKK